MIPGSSEWQRDSLGMQKMSFNVERRDDLNDYATHGGPDAARPKTRTLRPWWTHLMLLGRAASGPPYWHANYQQISSSCEARRDGHGFLTQLSETYWSCQTLILGAHQVATQRLSPMQNPLRRSPSQCRSLSSKIMLLVTFFFYKCWNALMISEW